jgi:hypothetical protein
MQDLTLSFLFGLSMKHKSPEDQNDQRGFQLRELAIILWKSLESQKIMQISLNFLRQMLHPLYR